LEDIVDVAFPASYSAPAIYLTESVSTSVLLPEGHHTAPIRGGGTEVITQRGNMEIAWKELSLRKPPGRRSRENIPVVFAPVQWSKMEVAGCSWDMHACRYEHTPEERPPVNYRAREATMSVCSSGYSSSVP
jgi:hypothetical protein